MYSVISNKIFYYIMSVFNNGLYDAVFDVVSEQTQYELINGQFQSFQETYNATVVKWNVIGASTTLVPTVETVDSGEAQELSVIYGLPKGIYICWIDAVFTGIPATGYLGCQLLNDDSSTIQPDSNTQAEYSESFTCLQSNTDNNNNTELAQQHIGVLDGLSPLYVSNEFTNIQFFANCDTASGGGQYGMKDSHIYIYRLK